MDEIKDLRIYLRVERTSDDYDDATGRYNKPGLRIKVTACDWQYVEHNRQGWTPTGILSSFGSNAHLAGLGTTVHIYYRGDDKRAEFIGHEAEYIETYRLTLTDLEAKVKFLRSVTKKLERLQERYGRAQGFAEWLPYFAEAIGCKSSEPFVVDGSDTWREQTGQLYRTHDADGVRYYLQELLKPFQPTAADVDA